MLAKIIDWLDERAAIKKLWHEAANEEVPGGARARYVFGSVLMFLFVQQVVLGILLAMYYSPSATDAWASTAYLNDQVTAGWFLRGLHHHGSSAMVIVTLLHFIQVALAGAYRKPRELNWLTGLIMAALVLGFALTGYLLPWDQKGYWATQVATSIMGSMPAGDVQQRLLQGGSQYGNLTITRFFALHVFVLPLGLGGLLAAHLALFRKHGVTPPPLPQAELDRTAVMFWPTQLFYDMVAMAITSAALVLVTFNTHGSELFAPAQPASNFVARPEWYFLFLFQLLKYFHGPSQIIATAIIPGAAAGFLVMLPWIDKAQSRAWKDRLPVLGGVALLMVGVVTLTVLAQNEDKNNVKYQAGLVLAEKEAEYARELAKKGVLPQGGDAVFENDPLAGGVKLFKENCSSCHAIDGVGGSEAPDFADYNSREWLTVVDPQPQGQALLRWHEARRRDGAVSARKGERDADGRAGRVRAQPLRRAAEGPRCSDGEQGLQGLRRGPRLQGLPRNRPRQGRHRAEPDGSGQSRVVGECDQRLQPDHISSAPTRRCRSSRRS